MLRWGSLYSAPRHPAGFGEERKRRGSREWEGNEGRGERRREDRGRSDP